MRAASLMFLAFVGLASGQANKFLLPDNIIPSVYNLSVFTHIEDFTPGRPASFEFHGLVKIQITCKADGVNSVVLHKYDDVVIHSAQLETLQGDSLNISIGGYDSETNKQTFPLGSGLSLGQEYILTLNYTGVNSNALTGFYRSSYRVGLKTRWLVVTDFEPFGARRAFPCFDEPALKAVFQLTAYFSEDLAQDGYVAHFNTDPISDETRDGWRVTTFKPTPLPISTYLVAFIIADFLSSPEPTYFNSSYAGENGTKPFYTVGQSKFFNPRQDLLSQVAGPAALNFMTQKTGVGFGFDKVEQAGIPDFAAGAMENWGLVTYRENLLFWDEQIGSTGAQQTVVTITAHELGHQWFGDLVTLHWWSDLWLNEGFATFFEFHAPDKIREPTLDTSSWDLIGQFVEDIVEGGAFFADGFSDARPLTFEAYDQNSIENFFDSFSYDKGGSVLRMWMHILGENNFYDGLNRYLNARKTSTGTPEFLLSGFQEALDALPGDQRPLLPSAVSDLLEEWHTQPGYPVVTVSRSGENLTLTQERFFFNERPDDLLYDVPISYSTDLEQNFENTLPVAFLQTSQKSAVLQLQNKATQWVVLNNQATGYYRVNYDESNWDKLFEVMDNPNTSNQIHPYNRAQILDDYYSLGFSAMKTSISFDKVLSAMRFLRHERNLPVWRVGLRVMRHSLGLLSNNVEVSSLLKSYFQFLIQPVFDDLSLKVSPTDSHNRKLLRADIASMACQLGIPECLEQSNQLYTSGNIHPDVRVVILCEAVKRGDSIFWYDFYNSALEVENPVRSDMLSALSCTQNQQLLKELVESANIDLRLTNQDTLEILFATVRQGESGRVLALPKIASIKSKSPRDIEKKLKDVSYGMFTEEDALAMEKLSRPAANMVRANKVWINHKYSSEEFLSIHKFLSRPS